MTPTNHTRPTGASAADAAARAASGILKTAAHVTLLTLGFGAFAVLALLAASTEVVAIPLVKPLSRAKDLLRRRARSARGGSGERGWALMVVLLFSMLLSMLALTVLASANIGTATARHDYATVQSDNAQSAALAAVLNQLNQSPDAVAANQTGSGSTGGSTYYWKTTGSPGALWVTVYSWSKTIKYPMGGQPTPTPPPTFAPTGTPTNPAMSRTTATPLHSRFVSSESTDSAGRTALGVTAAMNPASTLAGTFASPWMTQAVSFGGINVADGNLIEQLKGIAGAGQVALGFYGSSAAQVGFTGTPNYSAISYSPSANPPGITATRSGLSAYLDTNWLAQFFPGGGEASWCPDAGSAATLTLSTAALVCHQGNLTINGATAGTTTRTIVVHGDVTINNAAGQTLTPSSGQLHIYATGNVYLANTAATSTMTNVFIYAPNGFCTNDTTGKTAGGLSNAALYAPIALTGSIACGEISIGSSSLGGNTFTSATAAAETLPSQVTGAGGVATAVPWKRYWYTDAIGAY